MILNTCQGKTSTKLNTYTGFDTIKLDKPKDKQNINMQIKNCIKVVSKHAKYLSLDEQIQIPNSANNHNTNKNPIKPWLYNVMKGGFKDILLREKGLLTKYQRKDKKINTVEHKKKITRTNKRFLTVPTNNRDDVSNEIKLKISKETFRQNNKNQFESGDEEGDNNDYINTECSTFPDIFESTLFPNINTINQSRLTFKPEIYIDDNNEQFVHNNNTNLFVTDLFSKSNRRCNKSTTKTLSQNIVISDLLNQDIEESQAPLDLSKMKSTMPLYITNSTCQNKTNEKLDFIKQQINHSSIKNKYWLSKRDKNEIEEKYNKIVSNSKSRNIKKSKNLKERIQNSPHFSKDIFLKNCDLLFSANQSLKKEISLGNSKEDFLKKKKECPERLLLKLNINKKELGPVENLNNNMLIYIDKKKANLLRIIHNCNKISDRDFAKIGDNIIRVYDKYSKAADINETFSKDNILPNLKNVKKNHLRISRKVNSLNKHKKLVLQTYN